MPLSVPNRPHVKRTGVTFFHFIDHVDLIPSPATGVISLSTVSKARTIQPLFPFAVLFFVVEPRPSIYRIYDARRRHAKYHYQQKTDLRTE